MWSVESASWRVDRDVILISERSLLGYNLDLHSSCPLKNALLGFKLIRDDQVGVPQQVSVHGYNVLTNVELSLVAHDRIEYCQC